MKRSLATSVPVGCYHQAVSIFSVLAVIFVCGMASAQVEQSERTLCFNERCNPFPEGYHSIAVGGLILYIPVRRFTLDDWEERPEQVGEIVKGSGVREYADSPDGRYLLRRISSSNRHQFVQCCDELFSWFGLTGTGDDLNTLYLDSYGPNTNSYDGLSLTFLTTGSLPVSGQEITPLDLPADSVNEFSPSFWLLENDDTGFELVSRDPLLDGRFIHVVCRNFCYFRALRGSMTDRVPDYQFTLRRDFFSIAEFGSVENFQLFKTDGVVSNQAQEYFESSIEFIQEIEKMFLLASKLPTDLKE